MTNTAKKIKPQENIASLPHSELIYRVKEAMVAAGITNRALASKIGISQAALSQWFSGTYKGSLKNLESKARRWLATNRQAKKGNEQVVSIPNYVATSTAARIQSALSFAQATHGLAVVYGGAGMGKTRSAQEYAASHSNAWLTTVTPASATLHAVLERIALAIGIKPSLTKGSAVVETEILERLKDSDGLLIVDEAQHLRIRMLDQIRSIHDASETGLVLLGGDTLYSQLIGGYRDAYYAQIFSRISKRLHLRHPSAGDVVALADAMGVGGASERSLLKKIAVNPGALRGIVQTVRLASVLAGGGNIKADHIKQAWHELTETRIS